jgi:hypothetical protein
MRSQSKHADGYAAPRPTPNGIRERADAQSLRSAVDLAPFATVARKNKPLWLKARPLTLSLLGLALAVVLWGLEYKVSLYHPHPNHSARVGVAKLWVGPRNAVFAKSSRIRTPAAPAPELHLLTTRYVSVSDWNNGADYWEPELIRRLGHLSRQSTPRSPPWAQIDSLMLSSL